eukprot:m51a1_g5358 hypothetical protein (596) ;mRNA; f:487656-489695
MRSRPRPPALGGGAAERRIAEGRAAAQDTSERVRAMLGKLRGARVEQSERATLQAHRLEAQIEEKLAELYASSEACGPAGDAGAPRTDEDGSFDPRATSESTARARADVIAEVVELRALVSAMVGAESRGPEQTGGPAAAPDAAGARALAGRIRGFVQERRTAAVQLGAVARELERSMNAPAPGPISASSSVMSLTSIVSVPCTPRAVRAAEFAPPKLAASLADAFRGLDCEYTGQLAALEAYERDALAECAASATRAAAQGPAGTTWDEEDQYRFDTVALAYAKRGKTRPFALERLGLEFPRRPRAELAVRMDMMEKQRYCRHARRGLMAEWARARQEFEEYADRLLEAAAEEERAARLRDSQRSAIEQRQKELHGKARAGRPRTALTEEAEVLRQRAEANRAAEEEVAQARQKKQARERADKRAAVESYRGNAQRQQRESAEKARQDKQRAAEAARRRVEEARDRIQQREESAQAAAELRRNEAKTKEEELRQHAEAIKAAAENFAPKAKQDKGRVMKPTQAVIERGRRSVDVRFNKNAGYSEDQILKDTRFRMAEALQQAGVLHTNYGRQVLVAMAQPRFDCLTSDERGLFK